MNKIKNIYSKYYEIITYIFFGGVTTGLNIAVFFILNSLMNVNYLIANLISIIISILFAYIVNKKYVFRITSHSIKQTSKEMLLFFFFRTASLAVDMLAMLTLVEILILDPTVAKLITEVVVVVLNYLVSKFIVFKNHGSKERKNNDERKNINSHTLL